MIRSLRPDLAIFERQRFARVAGANPRNFPNFVMVIDTDVSDRAPGGLYPPYLNSVGIVSYIVVPCL